MARISKDDEFNKHDRRLETNVVLPAPAPQMSRDDVMQMLGAARYAEWLQSQAESHVLQFLMTVEDGDLFLATGDKTFHAFLERTRLKTKSTYYRKRELLLKEGPEQYDLFEEWKIPERTRRLLQSGDIVVDGDEVVIGGRERISMANGGSIKAIVEQLVREKIHATDEAAKCLITMEQQSVKLERTGIEKERLEGRIADLTNATPYEQALGGLFTAFKQLAAVVECMEPDEREDRAEPDLQEFTRQMHQLREAYGVADWQVKMNEIQAKEARA